MIPRLGASYSLIEGNSSWSYLPGSGEIPSGWNEPGFDDSGWAAGPAGIGEPVVFDAWGGDAFTWVLMFFPLVNAFTRALQSLSL